MRGGEPTGPLGSDSTVPPLAGSGRRFQLSAVHTSKACNVISKYTAFVPVDLSTSSYLPTLVHYTHTGNVGLAHVGPCPGREGVTGKLLSGKTLRSHSTILHQTHTQGHGQALGAKNLFPWPGKRSPLDAQR